MPTTLTRTYIRSGSTLRSEFDRARIRQLREDLNMTQENFAHEIGVTFATVNRWENGKGKPSPLAMRQIEELLRIGGER